MTINNSINKRYRNNAAYVMVRGYIINRRTLQQCPFTIECLVDTGFSSGLFADENLRADALVIGVNPSLTNISLANGRPISAYICEAYIEGIESYNFSPPGKKVPLYMASRNKKYIGMEALKYWVTNFNGPQGKIIMDF